MATEQALLTREEPSAGNSMQASTELAITGMTCGNCARHVTEALQSVQGVRSAFVNLDGQKASVRWVGDAVVNEPALLDAVKEAGFEAKKLEHPEADQEARRLSGWRLNLLIGIPGTLLLMIGECGPWQLGMSSWFRAASFVIAGIVQIFAGARFYRGAWSQLKSGSSNMDTLVSLGSTTAFAYSAWVWFSGTGAHLYFMEAASIITLISAGHWMESRVSVRAAGTLRKLLDLAPQKARRLQVDRSEAEVSVSDLKTGESVVLKPGDRIPTDGSVIEGNAAVDESMLTGESATVDKAPGTEVYAGTLNIDGRLIIKVKATGEETALAHIIAAVQRAQSSRANIQRLGDRVSSVFVPIVVVIAIATAVWWGVAPIQAHAVNHWLSQYLWSAHLSGGVLATALMTAAAVLIVACPCAMGLATPAAIMAGSNAAAKRGILIRDGIALEKAGLVTCVAFDKTGTLTMGKPKLVANWSHRAISSREKGAQLDGLEEEDIFHLAAAIARNSAHPISRAVAARSSQGWPGISQWRELRGSGIEAVVGNLKLQDIDQQGNVDSGDARVRLGALPWLREQGIVLGPGEEFIQRFSREGATVTGLSVNNNLISLFALRDTMKPGVKAVVEKLRRQGLQVYLVTGDNALTAATIAHEAGIEPANVFAEVRPDEKSNFVRKLQAKGERVAFVGDGINDAPALEQSDLGIAVSRASDIAREAADIILLNSEIEAVPESLELARATLRTIKQNLFWAFFYNALGIPLAALGLMSPILCAAAMALSDLVVIGNALRLNARGREAIENR